MDLHHCSFWDYFRTEASPEANQMIALKSIRTSLYDVSFISRLWPNNYRIDALKPCCDSDWTIQGHCMALSCVH